MSLYPGDPAPANAPTPPGSLPTSPVSGTTLYAPSNPIDRGLKKLTEGWSLEAQLLLWGGILLTCLFGVGYFIFRATRP